MDIDIDKDTYKKLIKKLISEMVFKKDDRQPPDDNRRGQFRAGWRQATMSESTLEKKLTWKNMGYRLKKELGDKNNEELNKIFKICADLYSEP